MSCILAKALVLGWCAATGPVDHYKVYRSDAVETAVAATQGPETQITLPCVPGLYSYFVIAFANGDPTEWSTMQSDQSVESLPIYCDTGMDANGDGVVGGPDFGFFTQAYGCSSAPVPQPVCP